MNLSKPQIIIIAVAGLIVVLVVGILTGIIPGARESVVKPPELKLTIWGVNDAREVIDSAAQAYLAANPNVQISYQKIDLADYETRLIDALAAGQGPDIFMIHSSWLPKHYNKILPATEAQLSLAQFKNLFPVVAEQDFAPDGFIYALPLYIDTLALYYNQDIFDSAGVALVPDNWADFQDLIPKLRQIDKKGNIVRAATALGGSLKSIDVAPDLLSLLMLQSGTVMTDENFTQANFADRRNDFPGLQALNFYTKFSTPENVYYTWNDNLNALDGFSQGQAATMFNYASAQSVIKEKNPFLNFRIAAMPQINPDVKKVDFASYWGLAVSSKSQWPEWAWSLIIYLTTDENAAQIYFDGTGHPPALKTLIDKYINDAKMGVFAKQALIARSWPQIDNKEVSKIFSQIIETVNGKKLKAEVVLDQAQQSITDLMSSRR